MRYVGCSLNGTMSEAGPIEGVIRRVYLVSSAGYDEQATGSMKYKNPAPRASIIVANYE